MAAEENNESNVVAWDPVKALSSIDERSVEYSRGFLRCRPEKWFPGFSASWLPLSHALGVELRLSEVQPSLQIPAGLDYGFAGKLNEELVAVMMAEPNALQLAEVLSPGAPSVAQNLVLEYFARRLLGSLGLAWSGPESSKVVFDRTIDPSSVKPEAGVKISFLVNNMPFSLWLFLGREIVQSLDGLWKRQLRSSSKTSLAALSLSLELASLAVPPAMLSDYTRPGTMIDLEVPASDMVTLRSKGRAWLPARLCSVDGDLAFEVMAGAASSPTLPAGHTRLSIELARVELDPFAVIELSQIGAIFQSKVGLSNRVNLVVNEEKIAEAELGYYEGRFAISVV